MKKVLNNQEMDLVFGGLLEREKDGLYRVFEISENGEEIILFCGISFADALKYDWDLFRALYDVIGVYSIEELAKYYNYGKC